jgi:hypothetical protein
LDKIPTPLNKLEVARTVTLELSRTVDIDDVNAVILLSPTKIDLSTVKSGLEPLGEQLTGDWPKVGSYYVDNIIAKYNGKTHIAVRGVQPYNKVTGQYDHVITMAEIEEQLVDNKVSYKYNKRILNNYYGRQEQREQIAVTGFKFEDLELFRIVVTTGDITGRVYRGL